MIVDLNPLYKKLCSIEDLLLHQQSRNVESLESEILGLDEACSKLHFTKAYMRKLMNQSEIPYYRPRGGKVYFRRSELEEWVFRGRQKTRAEIASSAALSK